MKVVHHNSLDPIEGFTGASSLTIGNFDGCHLGHQKLVSVAHSLARQQQLQTVVLTFDPHPREFFIPDVSVPRLFQPEQKLRALAELGVETVVIQTFDYSFSQLPPGEFCANLLAGKLKTEALTVGYDFRFGKGRTGTISHLQQYLPDCIITEVGEIKIAEDIVSSSTIRKHLQMSQIQVANQLLGRSYLLEGTIQRGRQLGRTIGFPTANIEVKLQMLPQTGVYCGWAILEKNAPIFRVSPARIPCIMNIGYRPTIAQSEPQLLVETHLLAGTYGQDSLYESPISIYIEDHLRGERKFASLDALKEQIELDCRTAKLKLEGL